MSKSEKPLSTLWGRWFKLKTDTTINSVTIYPPIFGRIFWSDFSISNLGCELNESNKQESFKTDDTNHQHQLALRTVSSVSVTWSRFSLCLSQMGEFFFFFIFQMCLGHTAKDEFNIVELISGDSDDAKGVPIATLHAKSMPTVSEIFLVPTSPPPFVLKPLS